VNVTSSQTINAVMPGFAEACSDGIVRVSTGGAVRTGPGPEDFTDAQAIAAVARITRGNFRLITRVERVMKINELGTITDDAAGLTGQSIEDGTDAQSLSVVRTVRKQCYPRPFVSG
jgi:hypothetical protein